MAENNVDVKIRASTRNFNEAVNEAQRTLRGLGLSGTEAGRELGSGLDVASAASRVLNSSLTSLAAGVAGAAGLAGMGALIRKSIDAAADMDALSQSTGVSVETLSRYSLAARQSGMDMGSLADNLSRLNKAIAEDNDQLKAMGIATRDANGQLRGTDDVLLEVAEAFAKAENGAAKSAAAQNLFGRSGADLIPFLNKGRDGLEQLAQKSERLSSAIGSDMAAQSAAFNDRVEEMGALVDGIGNKIAQGLLPTLNTLSWQFLDGASASDAFKIAGQALSGVLKDIATVGVGVGTVFDFVGKSLGGVAAAVVLAAKGEFSQAKLALDALDESILEGLDESRQKLIGIWTDAGDAAQQQAPKVSGQIALPASEGEKKIKAALDRTAEAVRKYLDGLRQQVEDFGKSDLDKELGKLFRLPNAKPEDLAEGEKLIRQFFELKAAHEAVAEAMKARVALQDELGGEMGLTDDAARVVELMRQGLSLEEARNRVVRENLEFALLEAEARGDTAQAALAAEKLRRIELERTADVIADARQRQREAAAEALATQRQLQDQLQQSLTDSIFRGFEEGKSAAEVFFDSLEHMAAATVLRPTIDFLVQPFAQALSGLMNAGIAGMANGAFSQFGAGFTGSALAAGPPTAAAQLGITAGAFALPALGAVLHHELFRGLARSDSQIRPGEQAALSFNPVFAALSLADKATGGNVFGTKFRTYAENLTLSIENGLVDATLETLQKRKRSLGGGTKYRSFTDAAEDLDAEINAAFGSILKSLEAGARLLGGDLTLTGSVTRNIQGDAAGVEQALDELVGQLASQLIPNLAEFRRESESLTQTYQRLISQSFELSDSLMLVNTSLSGAGLASAAANIAGIAGDNFGGGARALQQLLLGDTEQTVVLAEQLARALGEVNLSLPASVSGLREMVSALDLNTEAGQEAYARLLQLAPGLQQLYSSIETEQGRLVAEQIAGLQEQLQIGERLRGVAASIRGYLANLRLSALAPGDAESRALLALDQFRQLRALAAGGDLEASAGLRDAAQTALDLAREAFASGAEFQQIFNEVTGGLDVVAGILENDQTVANLIGLRAQIDALQTAEVTAIGNLQSAVVAAIGGLGGIIAASRVPAATALASTAEAAGLAAQGINTDDGSRQNPFRPQVFFASGGVFSGGIVTRPTAFSLGLMGEEGPEAILPLTRTSGGALGVQAANDPVLRQNTEALVRVTAAGMQQMLSSLARIDERLAVVERGSKLDQQVRR
jgi:hypothetical protein